PEPSRSPSAAWRTPAPTRLWSPPAPSPTSEGRRRGACLPRQGRDGRGGWRLRACATRGRRHRQVGRSVACRGGGGHDRAWPPNRRAGKPAGRFYRHSKRATPTLGRTSPPTSTVAIRPPKKIPAPVTAAVSTLSAPTPPPMGVKRRPSQ